METCCGYEYDLARIHPSSGFSRVVGSAPDPPEVEGSAGPKTLAPDKPISGCATVKKKRELFPGLPPTSPLSVTLPWKRPYPGAGILTGFPVAPAPEGACCVELPEGLGSTHPCPTAVHMEPFPTSVLKVLI